MQKTASRAILEQLAFDRRRIFAAWRTLILLRRATFSIPKQQRRWSQLPENIAAVIPILRQMENRGEIASIPNMRYVYEVTVPYATTGLLDGYEILMEVHPYCALSHASALSFHGLSDDLEKRITAVVARKIPPGTFPSGTFVEDWEGLSLPTGLKISHILYQPVEWSSIDNRKFFGIGEYRRFSYPLRVTDRERTLLDSLRDPELSGGIQNVLSAWVLSRDTLNIETIVDYIELFDIAILRQRAGFIMDTLGISHPIFKQWQQQAKRGGSSKLVSSAPYSSADGGPQYSEAWNLALNVPITALQEATS